MFNWHARAAFLQTKLIYNSNCSNRKNLWIPELHETNKKIVLKQLGTYTQKWLFISISNGGIKCIKIILEQQLSNINFYHRILVRYFETMFNSLIPKIRWNRSTCQNYSKLEPTREKKWPRTLKFWVLFLRVSFVILFLQYPEFLLTALIRGVQRIFDIWLTSRQLPGIL